jgi:hypothetical protein
VDNIARAHIMKDDQFRALLSWLDRHSGSDVPKFIASPASFVPRHLKATHGGQRAGALRSDAWDGYPASFDALLRHIADKRIRNVVFLSGDEHISFVTTAIISANGSAEVTRIHSIHSSGLYAPFAFANATRHNLAYVEAFWCGGYRCDVSTDFAAPGDGFALVRVSLENGQWGIECLFDREPRSEPISPK